MIFNLFIFFLFTKRDILPQSFAHKFTQLIKCGEGVEGVLEAMIDNKLTKLRTY